MDLVIRKEFTCIPGAFGKVIDLLRARAELFENAPGCVQARTVARYMGKPERLRTLDAWTSRDAARASRRSPAVNEINVALASLTTDTVGPEAYDVVFRLDGQRRALDPRPGVVVEWGVQLRTAGPLAAEYEAVSLQLAKLLAEHVPGLWGWGLYRYRGTFSRYRILSSYRSREDSQMWSGSVFAADSPPAQFMRDNPLTKYTDLPIQPELWEPGALD